MGQSKRAILGAILLLLAAPPAFAQTLAPRGGDSAGSAPARPARPSLTAVRAPAAPVIDGRLDDEVWQQAPAAADFRQLRPRPGEMASQRTQAWVAYDDEAVYVAIRAHDTAPDSIASQLARRDATGIYSDWVDVIIDSFHDRRTAYRFTVNPHGVKKDVLHYNDTQEDLSWDAVWDVATSIDDGGWTAEFRIPLSQIRYAPSDAEQTWGLQFGRQIARLEEASFWSPVEPGSGGFVSLAGHLTGLAGLGSPKRLEVLPYVVGRVTRAPAPDGAVPSPFWRATDPDVSVGADLRYGVSSNLTLTATFNPDFGQVEADPSVVNLSAFETFFPERRPFFLEGANLFTMNIGDDGAGENLFYSRRIGRAPQRTSFGGADHVDSPESARILGAGKLTGRLGDWSLGAFTAMTRAEHADVFRNGVTERLPVEPLTSYAVASLSRNFRDGASTIGVMATGTNRRIDDEAFDVLRSSAYSAGLTAQHRFGPGDGYRISGFLAASAIYGDTLAIQRAQRAPQRYYHRPDADHVEYDPDRTSLTGLTGRASIGRIAGRFQAGTGVNFRTPGFEVNDIGYQQNADERFVYVWMNYRNDRPGPLLRSWIVGFNPNSGWDFGGTRLWTQTNLWGDASFANFWSANFFVNNRWSAWSTRATRGGPALYQPGGNNFDLGVSTDRRRPVHFRFNVNGYREQETGALRRSAGISMTARPSPQFDLSLNPTVTWNEQAAQYVASPTTAGSGDRHYLFAALDQRTVSLTTRLNYTASPTLSFQLYAQPFISAGDYHEFRVVDEPRAREFDRRFHTFGSAEISRDESDRRYTAQLGGDAMQFTDPDFSVRSLRSNAVVRWEYSPGSTLFVVWSHNRSGFGDDAEFGLGRSVDDLRGLRGTNVLLLKLNYWLNL
ncbi:MAG TPA: DUF5916 domain-containing protein [Longimicrobiales bacterium]|nr:DUF5916 domain-containing protein [Longimicrobiales bacterium]